MPEQELCGWEGAMDVPAGESTPTSVPPVHPTPQGGRPVAASAAAPACWYCVMRSAR
jgi:hypothetical protein